MSSYGKKLLMLAEAKNRQKIQQYPARRKFFTSSPSGRLYQDLPKKTATVEQWLAVHYGDPGGPASPAATAVSAASSASQADLRDLLDLANQSHPDTTKKSCTLQTSNVARYTSSKRQLTFDSGSSEEGDVAASGDLTMLFEGDVPLSSEVTVPQHVSTIDDHEIVNETVGELGRTSEMTHKKQNAGRSQRKLLRQSGKEYLSSKGKPMPEKKMKFIQCTCRFKCVENLPVAERNVLHNQYWATSNWQAQSNFIMSAITVGKPIRRTVQHESRVKHIRAYSLGGKRICQKVFLATLGINHMRVNYCLNNKNKNGMCSPDKRGGVTANKTPDELIDAVKMFLEAFPKFASHYSDSGRVYFHPDLSLKKLHDLYDQEQKANERPVVSLSIFAKVFKTYNVGIYIPKSDTCQACDRAQIKLKCTIDPIERETVVKDLEEHHGRAKYARELLQNKTREAKTNENLLAISYDLQQTQPIPYLKTSVVFYKRQLWLYNFGINELSKNQGYMCVWHEGEGKRGSREVCSSIFQFLKNRDMSKVKKIHSFSDGCPGQNKNRNVLAFKMWICQQLDIDEWQHTYMESGHSFLPNDSDFAKIEKKKRTQLSIHSVEGWHTIIENAQTKNPFKIIPMQGKIRSCHELTQNRKFNNVDLDGEKFSYNDMKWFCVKRNSDRLHFKTSNDPQARVRVIEFPSKSATDVGMPLVDDEIKVSKEKMKDLKSLFPYIPAVYHSFYLNLPHDQNTPMSDTEI